MDTMLVRGGGGAPLRPCLWQPWLNPPALTATAANGESGRSSSQNLTTTTSAKSSSKEPAPSSTWRRDRRHKEYPVVTTASSTVLRDRPLDFSTTPRREVHSGHPPPPSYSHVMAARARPCVIQPSPQRGTSSPTQQPSPPTRSSASDPVIDEHFRRSLGKDYVSLFKPGTGDGGGENYDDQEYDVLSSQNNNTVMMTGLSVDDHFAKALGDTWVKLQNANGDTANRDDLSKKNMSAPSPDSTSSAISSTINSSNMSSVRRMPSGDSSLRNGPSVLSR